MQDLNERLDIKLQNITETCTKIVEDLQSDSFFVSDTTGSPFQYDKFFHELSQTCNSLHTVIGQFFILSKPPRKLADCTVLADQIDDYTNNLISISSRACAATSGIYFCRELKQSLICMFKCLIDLISASFNQYHLMEALTKRFWESCKCLVEMSQSNTDAVKKALKRSLTLIDDAISELDSEFCNQDNDISNSSNSTTVNNEHISRTELLINTDAIENGYFRLEPLDNILVSNSNEISGDTEELVEVENDGFSSLDNLAEFKASEDTYEIAKNCGELLKCCFELLNDAVISQVENELCTSIDSVQWLDVLCTKSLVIESIADSLVTSLYSPMDERAAFSYCTMLYRTAEDMINILAQKCSDIQDATISSLPKALEMKYQAISSKFPER